MVLKLITHQLNHEVDDDSISSTLTVERITTKQQLHHSSENHDVAMKQKKCVTFNLTRNAEYEIELFDEMSSVWYCQKDYRSFKSQVKDAANQIIQIEAKNKAPFSYQRVMEKTFNSCLHAKSDHDEILPESEFVHLLRWIEVASSRCGLEKWSLGSVSRDRSTRRREMNATVLSIQRSCGGSNESDEFIRRSCENMSRPSRLYATVMARALADAEERDVQ
jgi:hypothetical protein